MPGKKWCQYCRINLPYQKKAIQQHELTRLHIQNKEKFIKFERIKIQRQQKAKRELAKANNFTSTANIPKAKKGSQLEKQVSQYRNSVIMDGKMAIHQLIAQRTKGLYGAPIEYPEKQDLVLAQNYKESAGQDEQQNQQQKYEMWKIDICQQTGKPCFINRISQAKLYQPPKGYVMSQEQKQQWEYTKKICEQNPVEELEKMGQAGLWEQVEQEDYYQQNRAQQSDQNQQNNIQDYQNNGNNRQSNDIQFKRQTNSQKNQAKIEEAQVKKSWLDELKEKVQNNEVDQSQVISTMLTNTLQQCRTVKQKNEALKKLIKNDFQIRKSTINRNDDELLKLQQTQKKSIGFKPRKKVKVCNIVQDKDLE